MITSYEDQLGSEFRAIEKRKGNYRFAALMNIKLAMAWKYGRSQWGDPHMPWGGLGYEDPNYADPTLTYQSSDPKDHPRECRELAMKEWMEHFKHDEARGTIQPSVTMA